MQNILFIFHFLYFFCKFLTWIFNYVFFNYVSNRCRISLFHNFLQNLILSNRTIFLSILDFWLFSLLFILYIHSYAYLTIYFLFQQLRKSFKEPCIFLSTVCSSFYYYYYFLFWFKYCWNISLFIVIMDFSKLVLTLKVSKNPWLLCKILLGYMYLYSLWIQCTEMLQHFVTFHFSGHQHICSFI